MAWLRAERQQLIERFGKLFKNQYGWASELFDQNENPNFRELEELAGMEHMRPHYGWASHRVRAGAKGAALNVLHRGPYSAMLAGPTNWGLADPGHGTLVSLYQITTSLLLFGRPGLEDEPMRIAILRALKKLVDEAGEAFLQGPQGARGRGRASVGGR